MANAPTIKVSYPESDIAVLTLDAPDKGVNVLSTGVLGELDAALTELESRDDLAGLVVISAKSESFIVGADLKEFLASLDSGASHVIEMCRRGQTLFGRFSKCPFVTVAAIHGLCLGGGAELAVWCDRRVMSDSDRTEFGFPEVKLGLYPGWGGTVRAPRIVGLSNAIEMITGGDSIDAMSARALGLASDLVPADQLLPAAIRLVRAEQKSGGYLEDRERWSTAITIREAELGFLGATASAVIRQKTKGHYPAPQSALEVMLEGSMGDADSACQLEAEGMSRLFGSPVNAALLNVFFLTDRNKKDVGVDGQTVESQDIATVGVIGAGIMGSGIAAANIRRGLGVVITDAAEEALAKGAERIIEEAAYDSKAKGPTAERMSQVAPRFHLTSTDGEFSQCDLVIEAVVESLDVKRKILSEIEPKLGPDAILASNTSTIPITRLAEQLQRPDKFCGIHFFNPVRRMKLVEVIRGAETDDRTIATAVAYAKRVGKMPIVVNDGPGFLVNRLLFPYMNEALELVSEGAAIKSIERAAKAFGMPMGPIELYDMVGIDTAFYAGRTMWQSFPDRTVASPILPAMIKAGRLGQKSGSGFYLYNNRKRRAQADPDLGDFLAPYVRDQKQFTEEKLTARLFLPMLLEATRTLEDKVVRDPRDIDLGLIFGLGFPPFKGGLMFWADTQGPAKMIESLKPLEQVGDRMKPTELLLEMAQSSGKFYAGA